MGRRRTAAALPASMSSAHWRLRSAERRRRRDERASDSARGQRRAGRSDRRAEATARGFPARTTSGSSACMWAASTASAGRARCFSTGESARSCIAFAVEVDGSSITTVEGLAPDGQLNPLQQAFLEQHGLQCGYCTPGMLLRATEFLRENPAPTASRGSRGDREQPVPLHRLPVHRRRAARRRRSAAGGARRGDPTRRRRRARMS